MINKHTSIFIKFISASGILFALSYILGVNNLIALLLLALVLYARIYFPNLKNENFRILNLSLLFTLFFYLSYTITKQGWPALFIPFSGIGILSMLIFDNLVIALLLVVASSMAIAAINGNNLSFGLLSLVSGLLAVLLVKGARRRGVIIRSGVILGLLQALMLFLIKGPGYYQAKDYIFIALNPVVYSFLILGTLPVFEYLFNAFTNISLLELADFNHPLLQRMIMEAPGTYHHSLVVGNLAETAAKAVGAHTLLARIGAYYHDIGKLSKPDYFSENQALTVNKHDDLAPSISKLVIMNHVKEGVELAQKYHLNPRIIDFIQQHHGSSLVYYFYRRAIENQEEEKNIEEDGFRYPGPKPGSKETAIVMLADSVEAASRCLKEPTPAKIEELVHKIINNKFIDGQLDECELTLKEIEVIAKVFVRILSGIYHGRVNYPKA
ncbi:MAG: HDIG domain-containing protein [Candidatus Omnitrophica bacterium]|jgi:hypothetical protein|nr:HDIG domain-containing protein [Candidatus Omnitrophota bacterium]